MLEVQIRDDDGDGELHWLSITYNVESGYASSMDGPGEATGLVDLRIVDSGTGGEIEKGHRWYEGAREAAEKDLIESLDSSNYQKEA